MALKPKGEPSRNILQVQVVYSPTSTPEEALRIPCETHRGLPAGLVLQINALFVPLCHTCARDMVQELHNAFTSYALTLHQEQTRRISHA